TLILISFFFSSRRRHTRSKRDWSSDVCSSDLTALTKANQKLTDDKKKAEELTSALQSLAETRKERQATLDQAKAGLVTKQKALRSEERRVGKECRSQR